MSNNLHIALAGDLVFDRAMRKEAYSNKPRSYKSLWENVSNIIAGADLAYANLEGVTNFNHKTPPNKVPFRGAIFNYYDFLIDDLVETGFDVVSTANNHAGDGGKQGVFKTIDELHHRKLLFSGTRKNTEKPSAKHDWVVVTHSKGWRIGWIACTAGINHEQDGNESLSTFVLGCNPIDEMTAHVHKAKRRTDLDAVIVAMHMGDNWATQPAKIIRSVAEHVVEAGADVVYVGNPHVLQPWVWHDVGSRKGLIIYGLGNLIPRPQESNHSSKSVSTIAFIEFKRYRNHTKLSKVSYMPMCADDGHFSLVKSASKHGSKARHAVDTADASGHCEGEVAYARNLLENFTEVHNSDHKFHVIG